MPRFPSQDGFYEALLRKKLERDPGDGEPFDKETINKIVKEEGPTYPPADEVFSVEEIDPEDIQELKKRGFVPWRPEATGDDSFVSSPETAYTDKNDPGYYNPSRAIKKALENRLINRAPQSEEDDGTMPEPGSDPVNYGTAYTKKEIDDEMKASLKRLPELINDPETTPEMKKAYEERLQKLQKAVGGRKPQGEPDKEPYGAGFKDPWKMDEWAPELPQKFHVPDGKGGMKVGGEFKRPYLNKNKIYPMYPDDLDGSQREFMVARDELESADAMEDGNELFLQQNKMFEILDNWDAEGDNKVPVLESMAKQASEQGKTGLAKALLRQASGKYEGEKTDINDPNHPRWGWREWNHMGTGPGGDRDYGMAIEDGYFDTEGEKLVDNLQKALHAEQTGVELRPDDEPDYAKYDPAEALRRYYRRKNKGLMEK